MLIDKLNIIVPIIKHVIPTIIDSINNIVIINFILEIKINKTQFKILSNIIYKMNFENVVVKINVRSRYTDYNHPLNIYKNISSSGTGFFINKKQILTCYHVIKDYINIEVIYKQNIYINVNVKYIFPDDDLALIELDDEITDAIILDLKVITNKEIGVVYTIGFPLNSTNIKITQGIISGFQESLLQTDATLNHGNSGGPLVIKEGDKFSIIGVNVSKLVSISDSAGFVVPIYRFIILQKILNNDMIVKKPLLYFDYQKILQDELKQHLNLNNNLTGVIISLINPNYYYSNILKENEVILSINSKNVSDMGYIKFDFYPERININDIGLWFVPGDKLTFELYNPSTKKIKMKTITLEYTKTNLIEFYNIEGFPKYYIKNNNIILSIFSKNHLDNLKHLNFSFSQIIKILNRISHQQDLFTIYLVDLDINNNKFIKYPIGEVIIEINDKTFNNYDEFINIIKEPITKIKTINNEIYFI